MSPAKAQSGSASPYETVRRRCMEIDLPTWRFETSGVLVAEPMQEGVVGLWLRSDAMTEVLAEIVKSWSVRDEHDVVEVFPGAWAVPLPELHRRRLTGFTVALALGPSALESDFFKQTCSRGHLDAASTHRAISKLATFTTALGAERTRVQLQWLAADQSRIEQDSRTIEGFTKQLTDSYETIDMLYALGRSMNDLLQPQQFIELLCDRLFAQMNFGWIAAQIADTDNLTLDVRRYIHGTPECDGASFDSVVRNVMQQIDPSDASFKFVNGGDLGVDCCSPILAQPIVHGDDVLGVLLAGDKGGTDPQLSTYDTRLLEAASGYLAAFLEAVSLYQAQQAMFMGMLRSLTAAIDAKDRYTCGHSERVAWLAAELARASGCDSDYAERVYIAGMLHDVGKIGVPEAVLSKPGRLTDEEFDQIKLHPEIGYNILRDIPTLDDVLPGVLSHHERIDGRGYPQGLEGEELPLIARLLGLADSFDAMSSTRSYRAAMPREKVLSEIERCAGTQFDPELAKAFLTLDLSHYDEMVRLHAGADSGDPPSRAAA